MREDYIQENAGHDVDAFDKVCITDSNCIFLPRESAAVSNTQQEVTSASV